MQLKDFIIGKKYLLFRLADALLSALAVVLAFLIRFEGTLPVKYYERLPFYLALFVFLNLIFLHRQRLYGFIWSFVGLRELSHLFKALTYAGAIFAIIILIDRDTFNFFTGFPKSTIFLGYLLSLIFIGGLRISQRAWTEIIHGGRVPTGEPTLVVGAGRQGEHLVRNLQGETAKPYLLAGIVDDKLENQGTFIHGVPVLGFIYDIPRLVEEMGIRNVIVAFERDHARAIQETVQTARAAGVTNIKIVPEFSEILGQAISFRNLKEVTVEDLLGRDPAKIDTEEIKDFLRGKSVLVTGAAGSIGSELCRQISRFLPAKLLLLDFNESGLFDLENELRALYPNAELVSIICNVSDERRIESVVERYKPEIIFHAAAYKHVPLMEEFPEEATKINVLGTYYTAQAAIKNGVQKFVFISTDKAVKPTSVMGKTKRAAEMVIKSLNSPNKTNFVAVRFGNVLASRGSVVPLFQEQIRRGGPVTVTHPDMVRYFMTIPEAALLVMEAGAIGKGGEIFILDMGRPIKILELAKELIRLSGFRPDIDIPITITGVRPGEKLFEELLTDDEKRAGATKWEKIFISKTGSALDHEIAKKHIASIERLLDAGEEGPKLLKLVEEFMAS